MVSCPRLFWLGIPKFPLEHFFSIDMFSVWRQHLIFSKKNGAELRGLLTQRFATNTVLLSLMLSTEIGIFFSPSKPVDEVRSELENKDINLATVAGSFLCISILLSIAALACNFTAWGIFSVVSDHNVHCVLRSSLGMYGAQLPSRLVLAAMYFFLIQIALFWCLIMKPGFALFCLILGFILLIHIMSTYSAIGRVILATSAMSDNQASFNQGVLDDMEPYEVQLHLVEKLREYNRQRIPVIRQYTTQSRLDVEAGTMQTEELSIKEQGGSKAN